MRKPVLFATILVIAAFTAFNSFAVTAVKKDIKKDKKSFIYGKDPFEEKFFDIAKRVIFMEKELKLSKDQLKAIKLLMAETRLKLKERDLDIDTVTVGLNTYMWENPLETDTINILVMEKLHLQVEKQRFIVKSFKKLNEILGKEQIDAFKTSVK